MSNIQLYNEDCFETFARIGTETIDLVLCDPPYGTTQCKWDSVIPLTQMWYQLERVVKLNAAIVLMAHQPFTSVLIYSNLKLFRYTWTWHKASVAGFLDAHNRPLRVLEDLCVFYHKQPTYNPQKTAGKPYKMTREGSKTPIYGAQSTFTTDAMDGLRFPQNLVVVDEKIDPRAKIHPTQKPLDLMEYFIKTYTNVGDTVLDFAMGSGTTGVAAKRLGRNFIGCDSDKTHNYYPRAVARIDRVKPLET